MAATVAQLNGTRETGRDEPTDWGPCDKRYNSLIRQHTRISASGRGYGVEKLKTNHENDFE